MTGLPDFLATAMVPERWPTFALITARVSGLLMIAPGWSGTTFPSSIRAAVTVVLAVLLLPLAPVVPIGEHVLDLPLPMAAELAIGTVIGLAAAIIVQGVGLAGEIISMQMGLSIAPALAPVPELQVVGVGPLSTALAILIYLTLGGHLALIHALGQSLRTLPPGGGLAFTAAGPAATELAGRLFSCAVSVAAPVMVTLLLTSLSLAILSRAVPQLNAMMVSFPITIGVGLLMFAVSMPVVSSVIARWVEVMPAGIDRLLPQLQP
ncbi:MAG TPA: flagellar biosynthetic protein FliR [Candidatus Acidoferrales bacterium]|nr:flagellar biosynthetic protein FliR [Candidatus Acidoferrales bacterium]